MRRAPQRVAPCPGAPGGQWGRVSAPHHPQPHTGPIAGRGLGGGFICPPPSLPSCPSPGRDFSSELFTTMRAGGEPPLRPTRTRRRAPCNGTLLPAPGAALLWLNWAKLSYFWKKKGSKPLCALPRGTPRTRQGVGGLASPGATPRAGALSLCLSVPVSVPHDATHPVSPPHPTLGAAAGFGAPLPPPHPKQKEPVGVPRGPKRGSPLRTGASRDGAGAEPRPQGDKIFLGGPRAEPPPCTPRS